MKEKILKFLKGILSDRKKTIAMAIILVVLGFLAYRTFGQKKTTPQIQTAQVEKGTIISSVTASGTVLTSNITNINSQASGTVKKVYITNGDSVYTGQTIAEIALDTTGQQNQSQAYASYLSAKSALALADANYYTLQADLFAKNQAFINDAVARELETDDPTYIQENDNWLVAEAKFNNYQTDLAKAKASYNSSWLSYQESRALITAPSSGKINSLTIAEGMNLGAAESTSGNRASQRVASIITEGTPLATFNISEIDVSSVKPGQKATITIDSIADTTFTGKVVSVDRVGTATSGVVSYPVIIKFDTSSEQVLPNMAASVSIIIESKSDVLLVPSSAVQTQAGQSVVKVLKNGQQESVPVEIGLISDTQTEIVSGLAEGDEVVTGTVSSGQTLQGEGSPFGGFGGAGRIFR